MFYVNQGMTTKYPYTSVPIQWPFTQVGIAYWKNQHEMKQIFMIGNPVAWSIAAFGPVLWIFLGVHRMLFVERHADLDQVKRFHSIGFLMLAWICHYGPFFTFGRQLYLHHYFPAYVFSTLVAASSLDYFMRLFKHNLHAESPSGLKFRHIYICIVSILGAAVIAAFVYYYPLTYGTQSLDRAGLEARRWCSFFAGSCWKPAWL